MLTPKQKAVLDYIQGFSGENGYAPSQHEIAKHFGFKSLGTVQNYLIRLERHGFLRKAWNAKRGMEVLRDRQFEESGVPLGSSATTPFSTESGNGRSLIPSLADARKKKQETAPPPLSTPSLLSDTSVALPVLGRVAAGLPIEYAEYDQTVEVPLSLFSRPSAPSHRERFAENHYVLRVKGDSMIGDGILEGDYVVIEKRASATPGETVVAMIGNEATIKRFYKKKIPGGTQIELRAANPNYEPILIDSLTETRDFRIEGVMVGLIRKL
ncbi:MAG: transcriptional repressor LexA [Bdellovibrionales bacterium]|nr:transcriptional repressor LexA [Bdellovibrionales bacterium]